MKSKFWAALCLAVACAGAQAANTPANTPADEVGKQVRELKWLPPGSSGSLDGKAVFKTSEAYTFLDPAETDKFLKLNGNPPQGSSVTIAPAKGSWFGILRFSPEGYVKDDDKIDADALLKTLKEQNAESNEAKRKQGYEALVMEGWALPPRYDRDNKRLEWGTLLRADDKSLVANVSTKVLGRTGYTSAVLVTTPETLDADLKDFKTALKDFDYVSGEKYSEWREGDKVAAYGLGALVLGGAAAVVSSKGGFKVIGLAILAFGAAVWGGIKRLFGKKS